MQDQNNNENPSIHYHFPDTEYSTCRCYSVSALLDAAGFTWLLCCKFRWFYEDRAWHLGFETFTNLFGISVLVSKKLSKKRKFPYLKIWQKKVANRYQKISCPKNLGISTGAKKWMTRRKKAQTKPSWILISMMSLSFFPLVLKTLMPWPKLYLSGVTHPLLSGHHWVQGETALTLCDLDFIRLVSLFGASEYQNWIS